MKPTHLEPTPSLRYLYCDYSAWVFSATLCCRLCPAYQFLFHPDSFIQILMLLCVLNRRVLSRIFIAKQSKNVVFIFLSQHILWSSYTSNLEYTQHRKVHLLMSLLFYFYYRNSQGKGIESPISLLAFSKFPERDSQDISQAAERMEMSIQVLKQNVCQKHRRSLHPTGKYISKNPCWFLEYCPLD